MILSARVATRQCSGLPSRSQAIDTATPGALAIQFENNGHNVQLDLPLDFKLGWK